RRRAAALLVDGMIVAVLANAPAVFFGAALAFVLLKASARPVAGGLVRRSVRWTQRFAAALVVFATVVSLGWAVGGDGERRSRGGESPDGGGGAEWSPGSGCGTRPARPGPLDGGG